MKLKHSAANEKLSVILKNSVTKTHSKRRGVPVTLKKVLLKHGFTVKESCMGWADSVCYSNFLLLEPGFVS